MKAEDLHKVEVAAVNKFADKIRNYLFERIAECDNMTAEDPIWVNRLKWSSEATVIFLNECLAEFTEETMGKVMEYKTWLIGFRKAGGKEYQITVMAESGPQAVRIASNALSSVFGEGDFYIIGEKEN